MATREELYPLLGKYQELSNIHPKRNSQANEEAMAFFIWQCNAIERSTLTLKDVEEVIATGVNNVTESNREELEAVGLYEAMKYAIALVEDNRDLTENDVKNTVASFKPLEHRMEFVANINNVSYYNDSIATIPESTINAVEALKNVNTILVGGNDRGVDLKSLIKYLKNHETIENIICLPKTGEYIKDGLIGSNKNVVFFEDFKASSSICKKSYKRKYNLPIITGCFKLWIF